MSNAKSLAAKLSGASASKKIKSMESIRSTCRREPNAIKSVMRYVLPLLLDEDGDVRLTASRLVLDFSKLDPKAVGGEIKHIIDVMKKAMSVNMDDVETDWEPYANLFIAIGNVSSKYPDIGGRFVFLMMRALKYPMYHPERPADNLHMLYAASIRAIGKVGVVQPAYVKEAIPQVYKALLDSYRFQFWKNPLKKKDEDMKYCAMDTLTRVGIVSPGIVVPSVSTAFIDKDKKVIAAAREILSMLAKNLQMLFPALMDALEVDKKKLRERITEFVVELGRKYPSFIIPQLTSRLEDPRMLVKFHSASALGELFPTNVQYIPSVIPSLIDHLGNDPDLDVRQTVSDALNVISEINTEIYVDYVPNVISALGDEYHHVRWRTAQIIKNIGTKRPDLVYEAIPYLIAGLDDRHDHVGWKCRDALEVLGVDKVEYQLVVRSIKVDRDLIKKAKEIANVEMPDIEKMVEESAGLARNYRFKESIERSKKAKELIERKVPYIADGGMTPFPGQMPGYPQQMGYPQRAGAPGVYMGPPQEAAPPPADPKKREKRFEKYRKSVRRALSDGVITGDEAAILADLRDVLEIPSEEHEHILAEEKALAPEPASGEKKEDGRPGKEEVPPATGEMNWDEYESWGGDDDDDDDDSDDGEPPVDEFDLDAGYSYMLKDDDPSRGFEYLSDAAKAGRDVLFVTRNHPRKITRKYDLADASHIWLTKMPGENNVKPDEVDRLRSAGEEFLKGSPGGIMMIEGIDYIVSHNNFDDILGLVQFLKDLASVTETILVISVSPSILDANELKTLELEVDSIL